MDENLNKSIPNETCVSFGNETGVSFGILGPNNTKTLLVPIPLTLSTPQNSHLTHCWLPDCPTPPQTHCWCWLPSYYCHFTLALNAAQILLVAHNKSSFFFLWRRNLILKLNLVTQDQSRAGGDFDARDTGLHGHKTPPRPLPVPQVVSRGPFDHCLKI